MVTIKKTLKEEVLKYSLLLALFPIIIFCLIGMFSLFIQNTLIFTIHPKPLSYILIF